MGKPNCACHTLIRSYTTLTHTPIRVLAHTQSKCTIESAHAMCVFSLRPSNGSQFESIVSASIEKEMRANTRYSSKMIAKGRYESEASIQHTEKLNSRASRVCIQSFSFATNGAVCIECKHVHEPWEGHRCTQCVIVNVD